MDDYMANESPDELQNTISMFEQILEVMPSDQLALRTLYKAYLHLDDRDKAFDRLNRLADALLEEYESEDIFYLVKQFNLFADYNGAAVAARLEMLTSLATEASESSDLGAAGTVTVERDIDQEMALAWRLFEEELLSHEEYSSVVTDLTESSSRNMAVPATVLHVFSDRGFKHIGRIMHYMVEHSGMPYISLSSFELREGICDALPLEFVQKRAALPFGKLGGDLMIAVLNPFNEGLVRDVETATGCTCHSYLVEPMEYDAALAQLQLVSQRG